MFHLNSFSSLTLHSRSLQKLGEVKEDGHLARLKKRKMWNVGGGKGKKSREPPTALNNH
jgi:hypothetical protein